MSEFWTGFQMAFEPFLEPWVWGVGSGIICVSCLVLLTGRVIQMGIGKWRGRG